MKIKTRSQDAGRLYLDGWLQVDEWLAELRVASHTGPPGDLRAETDGGEAAVSGGLAQAGVLAEARAQAEARPDFSAIGRAVIGDQLRIPVMWCELGSCIAWYADHGALGEADTRARAIEAGWRIDGLGRLACPSCQQTDSSFWAPLSVVPWDRYLAMARATRATGVSRLD